MTRRRGSKRRGSRRRGGSTAPFVIKTDSVESYNKSVYAQADAMIKLWGKMRSVEMQQSIHNQRAVYKKIADDIAALLKHGLMATLDEKEFDSSEYKAERRSLVSIAKELNDQITNIPEAPFFDGDVAVKVAFFVDSTNKLDKIDYIRNFFKVYLDEAHRERFMNTSTWYDEESPSPYSEDNASIWHNIEKDLTDLRDVVILWSKVLAERRATVDKMIEELSTKESPDVIKTYKEAANEYFDGIINSGDYKHEKSMFSDGTKTFPQNELILSGKKPVFFKSDDESKLYALLHKAGNYQNDSRTSSYYHDGRTRSSTTYDNKYSVVITQNILQKRINENRAKVVVKSIKPYSSAPVTAWMSQLYSEISI